MAPASQPYADRLRALRPFVERARTIGLPPGRIVLRRNEEGEAGVWTDVPARTTDSLWREARGTYSTIRRIEKADDRVPPMQLAILARATEDLETIAAAVAAMEAK